MKKHINMFFVFYLLLGTMQLQAQRPVACYFFNNSAQDQSGYQNHGQLFGGVTPVPDRFGNPCSAYYFDGSSGYIKVPTSSSLESPRTALTICVWYKIANPYSNLVWLTAVCKGENAGEYSDNPQYRLQVQQNSNVVTNACSLYAPSTSSTISLCTNLTACDNNFSTHPLEIEKWHFYCIVYDGSEMRAYLDGAKIFSTPFSQTLTPNRMPLYIGMDEPGNNEFFNGALDDIRIYNVTLSEKEINRLYNEKGVINDDAEFEMPFQKNIKVYATDYSCTANASFNINTPVSKCGKVNLIQKEGLPSGSEFQLGRNRISFEATSESGYREVLSFFVDVSDTSHPQLDQPSDMVVEIPSGQTLATINYTLPQARDNCTVIRHEVVSGPTSGSALKSGIYQVKVEAEDNSRNVSAVTWKIHVKDAPKPVIVDSLPVTQTTIDTTQKVVVVNAPIPVPPVIQNTNDEYFDKDTLSVNYKPNNLIFLLDVSSSMLDNDKIKLLKKSVSNIVKKLRTIDRITVITYAESVTYLMEYQEVNDKKRIIQKIDSIVAFGGTDADLAVSDVYQYLSKHYLEDGNNDIYMATDGLFSLEKKNKKIIENAAKDPSHRITLNILGLGKSAKSLEDLKEISDKGKGQFLFISSIEDATNLIINQIKINSQK